jgi:hypothetical protein
VLRVSRIERHDGGSDLEGHVISVDAVDLSTTQDLKIPVVVQFAEPTPIPISTGRSM